MKHINLFFLLILIYGCGSSKSSTSTEKTSTTDIIPKVELTEVESKGKTIFENNCAKCHKLYDPKSFDAIQWKPILARMQSKAKISDEEREMVYAYLVH